eukprot:TRINITY_DN135626_c0_g1_i1.p1 TRINITY_DN135626_c0_g1~~TRINITY_DN135626_c0_g1_i1.p1  ORF type:complete len:412 (-),score=12.26 TRINITY_DN135626_c0_g1_i1:55-1290(-)
MQKENSKIPSPSTGLKGISPNNVIGVTLMAKRRPEKIIKKMLCKVCQLIPHTMVQCAVCKKVVCLHDYDRAVKITCKCPDGTSKFDTPDDTHYSMRGTFFTLNKGIIDSLIIRCKYFDKGCGKILCGCIKALEHEKVCKYGQEPCEHCGKWISPLIREEHKAKCDSRAIVCKYCGESVRLQEWGNHSCVTKVINHVGKCKACEKYFLLNTPKDQSPFCDGCNIKKQEEEKKRLKECQRCHRKVKACELSKCTREGCGRLIGECCQSACKCSTVKCRACHEVRCGGYKCERMICPFSNNYCSSCQNPLCGKCAKPCKTCGKIECTICGYCRFCEYRCCVHKMRMCDYCYNVLGRNGLYCAERCGVDCEKCGNTMHYKCSVSCAYCQKYLCQKCSAICCKSGCAQLHALTSIN